jgi:hypothetical protein
LYAPQRRANRLPQCGAQFRASWRARAQLLLPSAYLRGETVPDELRDEIYRSMVLLGADELLLGAMASWNNGVPERDVLADLRNWNDAKLLELKEWLPSMAGAELTETEQRVEQYEALEAPPGR